MNLHHGTMEICALKNGALEFYNVFKWNSDEDILYYLLFSLEQFGFDAANVRLTLAGERPLNSALFDALKRYFKHINYTTPAPSLKLSGDLARLPSHYYFSLLNQHLCE